MDILVIVAVMILLLLFKGFFSGSEIALVNADRIRLSHRAKQGHRGSQLTLKMLERAEILLSTTLVGTNLSTIALTTLGTLLMIRFFGHRGDLLALIVFTPLLLILGEIVPKSVYQQKSDEVTPIIVHPLRWFSILFFPIVFVFSRVARFAARVAGGGKSPQSISITREQLRALVEVAEQGEAIGALDRDSIRRVIRFAETTVAEAMIPIAEVTTIGHHQSTERMIELVRRHGFNRLPVYENSTNNIIGIVTVTTWDLLDHELSEKPLQELIRPAHYVSPLQTIDQLLPILHRRQDRMAIVVDEFGSAIGMISMEDIVEEVLGEIDVGYDFDEYLPKRKSSYEMIDDGIFLIDSRLSISAANEILGIRMPTAEFHTIGGLILARLRHIPKVGEFITESGRRFVVEEATERAILKVRVELEVV